MENRNGRVERGDEIYEKIKRMQGLCRDWYGKDWVNELIDELEDKLAEEYLEA